MTTDSTKQDIRPALKLLRCPQSGQAVHLENDTLTSADGQHSYSITAQGIPLLGRDAMPAASRRQRDHYRKIAEIYVENLSYPHTDEYNKYLDAIWNAELPAGALGNIAEICCGTGDALEDLAGRYEVGIGIDICEEMLAVAREKSTDPARIFMQGDATQLPITDASIDYVFVFGGIHHVPDRADMFNEIARILKPGGIFIYREPVDDFFLWRWLRSIIYRLSPTLEENTESPLRRADTLRDLTTAGLTTPTWRTCGFLGFCFLMNSDVLIFNQFFRFIPGIRLFSRCMTWVDEGCARIPGLRGAGLQVVGVARKPNQPSDDE